MTEGTLDSVEVKAIREASAHYKGLGWTVQHVSRVRGEHSGYDFFLTRGNETLRVEVKGCTAMYGIPDLYETEIDPATNLLVADELCIVYCSTGLPKPKIAVIPRLEIPTKFIKPKLGYRISSRFKKAEHIDKFFVS